MSFRKLRFALSILTVVPFAADAWGKEMFTGNETNLQIVDKIRAAQAGLYDRRVVVFAGTTSHEGVIIGTGSSFLILESETGRSNIESKPPQKIYSQKLITLSSIVGFEIKVAK